MHSVSKHMRHSEPTTKILMKIHPYCHCQQWRCSPATLVSGNIRFMRLFAGVLWKGGVKRQWGNRKRRFSGPLFSPLSPFHWSQNTWPWITFNGHFMLNFHYYEQLFVFYLFYVLTVELVYITWPSKMCGSGPWSAEYLGSAEGLRIFRRRCIVGILTNKANISI